MSVAERNLRACRDTNLGGCLLFEVAEDRVLADSSGHLGITVLVGYLLWFGALRKTEMKASSVVMEKLRMEWQAALSEV
jgi:hypothetical protein